MKHAAGVKLAQAQEFEGDLDMEISICPHCGGKMVRSRRLWRERSVYAAAYRCLRCSARVRVSYWSMLRVSRHVRCPECGRYDVQSLREMDKIDRVIHNPVRVVQRLLGAQAYRCRFCRLQFYDVRLPRPSRGNHLPTAS